MKKNKSKSENQSTDKKQRKELKLALIEKFKEVIGQFGKTKKTEKIVERFSKQIAKKLSSGIKQDSIDALVKEEKVSPTSTEQAKVVEPIVAKVVSKKPKAAAKAK